MVHNDLCVGIDLGTTNSVIATCSIDCGRIETPVSRIERYEDMSAGNNYRKSSRDLLPSCVYYADMKDGNYEPIVGDFAKTVSFTQPFAVAKSIKRQMGQPAVNIPGWKPEYPDQTPEAVAARILRHMLASLEEYYGETITDAVITVPASFNPAQREATLRAAEIAGLEVRELDGSYRDDILISEPEAVLYDVLNQVQNGKINIPIDFSRSQKVLVFDIGGGTLDITLHEISKAAEAGGHFEIRPLATNRFSTVAGDQFDQTLAAWMYKQYIEYYRLQDAGIAKRIEDNKQSAIPFLAYAEELKVKVSNQYKDRQKRGKPLAKDQVFDYGGFMPNGYNSENDMTLEEFETVLSPLLGNQYSYDDYKRFEEIKDDKNIIFPVLNVLYKAAKKLESDTVKVDAVVLNGGMSRLYLIEERLTRFFGLRPITVNDPDKSVAQGASVYHHYLHQSDSAVLRDLHRRFLEEQEQLDHKEGWFPLKEADAPPDIPTIRSMSSIVNESLYLGAKGGAVHLLVNSGEDLPYQSPAILEFGIAAGQTRLRIPIKQAVTGGEYRTIASGDIEFKKQINHETRVAIQFLLRRNGILTLQAWTYSDDIGMKVIERGSVTLDFNTANTEFTVNRRGRKVLPPSGSNLIVANELSSFKGLLDRLKKCKNKKQKKSVIDNIKLRKKTLLSCGNPADFAEGSLRMLRDSGNTIMNMNYLPIARTFSRYWTEEEKKELSRYCITVLGREFSGLGVSGLDVSANNEAIKTIGVCGVEEHVQQLFRLPKKQSYRSALLYAFGCAGQEVEWICGEVEADVQNGTTQQDSMQALGLALSHADSSLPPERARDLAVMLAGLLISGTLDQNEVVLTVIALGELCGQRSGNPPRVEEEIAQAARQAISTIPETYGEDIAKYSMRARLVAEHLIAGDLLSDEDESYLLSVLYKS